MIILRLGFLDQYFRLQAENKTQSGAGNRLRSDSNNRVQNYTSLRATKLQVIR